MTKRGTVTTPAQPVAGDDVLAEVERLNGQELRLAMLYREKHSELATVKAERGDQVLDAADPAGSARQAGRRIGELLEELESFADGSRRARERRLMAIPAVFEAAAGEKERKADELEAEATKLEAASKQLREALEKHDEWAYFAAEGKIDGRYFASVPQGGGQYRVIDARGPIFKLRRTEAQVLRQQATQHRLQKPHQAGGLEADTVEQLLADVYSDAMRIGPTVDAVIEWAEKAFDKERRRRARALSTEDAFVRLDAPMRLHLEWRAGVIDQVGSNIIEPDPSEIEKRSADGVDVGKFARRPNSSRSPFDTSATPAEIAREAAATGKSIKQVAKEFGVPVPSTAGVEGG